MEIESYKYLVNLLTEKFTLVGELDGKTIKTVYEEFDDWIVIISTDNEILPYRGQSSYGDLEFYCENDTNLIFRQIARKICHTAEYVGYRKTQDYRNEYQLFISLEEFQTVCDMICKDKEKMDKEKEKRERDEARKLLAKFPDLLNE